MHQPSETVWYFCYGSNLSEARFLCYIRGGTPEGATKPTPGCRNTKAPSKKRGFEACGKLYFAKESLTWGGGGVAFIDPSSTSKTLGRLYLISYDQFQDVFAQENRAIPSPNSPLPSLFELTSKPEQEFNGIGWYGRVMHLGDLQGQRVLTFTAPAKNALLDPRKVPSEAYAKTIIRGLLETYVAMTNDEICDYLMHSEGIAGHLSRQTLIDWISEARG